MVQAAERSVMPSERKVQPRLLVYAFAVLLSVGFLWLRSGIDVAFGHRPLLILFMFPILLSALLGGLGAGLLSTAIVAVGIDYLAIPPEGSLWIAKGHDQIQWLFLIANGVLASVLSDRLHRAEHNALAGWRETDAARRELKEAQYRAGVGSWHWDVRSGIHTWSDEIYRIFGRDRALPPMDYPEVGQYFTLESWGRLSAAIENVVAQGAPCECDAEVVRPDGVRRWVLVRGEAVRDEEGQIVSLYGTVQDITQRKLDEIALAESENRFRALVEQNLAGIYVIQDGLFRYVNPGFAAIFGYDSPDEVIDGVPVADLVAPEDRQKVVENVTQRLRGGAGSIHYTFTGLRRDAGRIEVEVHGHPYDFQGRPAVIGLLLDITERRRAEAEVRVLNTSLERRVAERTAELVAANKELDSFAYAVSHDLRAPLRAMNGFATALEEDYGATLTGEARLFLDQISIASRKMAELIDGLLAMSRSTRGELVRETVDLSAMAERLLGEMARQEPERGVSWQIQPGIVVDCDPRMMEVAMDNLLGNAWKYTSRNGDPEINVYLDKGGGNRKICVADNGAGFNMEHAGKLFQPFQRLHRQDEFAGIGIGLATVQRIIHRHGGRIEAVGRPGEGARFCFTMRDENNIDSGVSGHEQIDTAGRG